MADEIKAKDIAEFTEIEDIQDSDYTICQRGKLALATIRDYCAAAAEAAASPFAEDAEEAETAAQAAKTAAESAKDTAVSAANGATAAASGAAQSEANALASKNAAEAAAQIAQETDAGALMLSKLGAGQLWFDRGVLSVPAFANLSVTLPISLAIEYDVESWEGLGTGNNNGIVFLSTRDVEWTTPNQLKGFYLRYTEDKTLTFHSANADSTPLLAQFSAITTNGNAGLPTGKHTLMVCVGGEIVDGKPSHFEWYLDGLALPATIIQQTMTSSDITSTRALAVAQADNYSNPTVIGGAKIPARLSRVRIFNFDMSAEGAPYTIADYTSGKPLPPALCDTVAAARALLALEDYSISVGATRYVPDVSGNAYDATVIESGGSGESAWTGSVKGTRDAAIKRLCDLFNANNQSA